MSSFAIRVPPPPLSEAAEKEQKALKDYWYATAAYTSIRAAMNRMGSEGATLGSTALGSPWDTEHAVWDVYTERVLPLLKKMHTNDSHERAKKRFRQHFAGENDYCDRNGSAASSTFGLGESNKSAFNLLPAVRWTDNAFEALRNWDDSGDKSKGKPHAMVHMMVLMQIKDAMGEVLYYKNNQELAG